MKEREDEFLQGLVFRCLCRGFATQDCMRKDQVYLGYALTISHLEGS